MPVALRALELLARVARLEVGLGGGDVGEVHGGGGDVHRFEPARTVHGQVDLVFWHHAHLDALQLLRHVADHFYGVCVAAAAVSCCQAQLRWRGLRN